VRKFKLISAVFVFCMVSCLIWTHFQLKGLKSEGAALEERFPISNWLSGQSCVSEAFVRLRAGNILLSGCFISPAGRVVTAWHGFDDSKLTTGMVLWRDKLSGHLTSETFLLDKAIPDSDVAFLTPKRSLAHPVPFLAISEHAVPPGATVWVYHPARVRIGRYSEEKKNLSILSLALTQKTSQTTSRFSRFCVLTQATFQGPVGGRFAVLACSAQPGSSGSPVLNADNELIGVASGAREHIKGIGANGTLWVSLPSGWKAGNVSAPDMQEGALTIAPDTKRKKQDKFLRLWNSFFKK
jgi:hypothetical protein